MKRTIFYTVVIVGFLFSVSSKYYKEHKRTAFLATIDKTYNSERIKRGRPIIKDNWVCRDYGKDFLIWRDPHRADSLDGRIFKEISYSKGQILTETDEYQINGLRVSLAYDYLTHKIKSEVHTQKGNVLTPFELGDMDYRDTILALYLVKNIKD